MSEDEAQHWIDLAKQLVHDAMFEVQTRRVDVSVTLVDACPLQLSYLHMQVKGITAEHSRANSAHPHIHREAHIHTWSTQAIGGSPHICRQMRKHGLHTLKHICDMNIQVPVVSQMCVLLFARAW